MEGTIARAACVLLVILLTLAIWLKNRARKAAPTSTVWRYCPWCGGDLVNITVGGKPKLGCSRCSFVHWNNPKPNCKTLIPTTDGGIVLVRVGSGGLELPGGYVEPFETLINGAKRETLEETGLAVEILRELAVHMLPGGNEQFHFYLTKPVSEKPVGGDDALEALIAPLSNIPFDQIKSEIHRAVIRQWLKEIGTE